MSIPDPEASNESSMESNEVEQLLSALSDMASGSSKGSVRIKRGSDLLMFRFFVSSFVSLSTLLMTSGLPDLMAFLIPDSSVVVDDDDVRKVEKVGLTLSSGLGFFSLSFPDTVFVVITFVVDPEVAVVPWVRLEVEYLL